MSKGPNKPRVSYTAPSEPAFLRRIKQQLGYKAPDTVDRKRDAIRSFEASEGDRDDLHGREEDRPVIVQLKDGDLDEEEVDEIVKKDNEVQEKQLIADGKITFKRPAKRAAPTTDGVEGEEETKEKSKAELAVEEKKARRSKTFLESNTRLLSFQDDEEEEED